MNVLVLNSDFRPINITTLRRGFNLVYKGRAEIVDHHKNNSIESSVGHFKRPSVIRLINYVYLPFKKVPMNKKNIFKRDGNECGYCGSKTNLTLDHIKPKSKGGEHTWDNLITCCKKCNEKKDDLTPSQAGLTMRIKPYRPTFNEFALLNKNKLDSWLKFLTDDYR